MPKVHFKLPARAERTLDAALDKAIAIQRPAVISYVDTMRRRHPGDTPAELVTNLERHYRTLVIGIGGAAGAAAAVPGAGTAAAVASGAAEITAFVSATAMYVLALAEVHGVPMRDPQLRRALVLTVLVGESGEALLAGVAAETPHWAAVLGRTASKEKIAGVNVQLAHLFMTRVGTRQGALAVGRAIPPG